ncbi:MAG: hypothetical protein C0621_05825 [Desulfuromonas sp.]|nr:MAG: hypothetical protein C0621_05825 [Desulfuromonas sp.]
MKKSSRKNIRPIVGTVLGAVALATVALTGTAQAGVKVYEDKESGKFVEIGARLQMQYHLADPDGSSSSDSVFFRRLRPYIAGSVHKDWLGKFQWDMGKAEDANELAVKDAYVQYKGIDNLTVTIGNAQFPFSREDMTSSKAQQLVERTFVGDHDFGTPELNAGVFLHYTALDKTVELHVAGASADIDPDASKLDFDTPINANSDFNEGVMLGGRVDFHPLGKASFDQGDFKGEPKATVSLAAYTWSNDDDNNTYTTAGASTSASKADVDSVTGVEVSGGFRGHGLSVDAQYNVFAAETVDTAFTGGIFKNGETSLTNYAVEGGYMVVPKTFELVAGYEAMDADNYTEVWKRTSIGANYFFVGKKDIKLQTTYRMGENLKGQANNDANELFVQMQYVF